MAVGAGAARPSMTGSRRRMMMYAGIAAGLGAALLAFVAINSASEDSEGTGGSGAVATAQVVVASHDIAAGARITEGDLELRAIPENAVHQLSLTDMKDAVGKAAAVPIYAGEQVLGPNFFEGPGRSSLALTLPPGMRATAIAVAESTGVGGLVAPGDQVDVIAVFGGDGSSGDVRAVTVVENVQVLAVAQEVVPRDPQQAEGEADPQPDAKSITLAVTPEQAQALALAEEAGNVRVVVRANGDTASTAVSPLDVTDVRGPSAVPDDDTAPAPPQEGQD